MNNISEILDFSIKLAKDAGEIQNSYFGKIDSIKSKSNNIDLLTVADTESEKYIIYKISKEFPDHSIMSE